LWAVFGRGNRDELLRQGWRKSIPTTTEAGAKKEPGLPKKAWDEMKKRQD
jgi:hypothetical protein